MQSCSVRGCQSYKSIQWKPVAYFKFPHNKQNLFQAWLKEINQKDFKPTHQDQICSTHFLIEDIEPSSIGRYPILKPEAVPSVFPERRENPQPPKKSILKSPAQSLIKPNISQFETVLIPDFVNKNVPILPKPYSSPKTVVQISPQSPTKIITSTIQVQSSGTPKPVPIQPKPMQVQRVQMSPQVVKFQDKPSQMKQNSPSQLKLNSPIQLKHNSPSQLKLNSPSQLKLNSPSQMKLNSPGQIKTNSPGPLKQKSLLQNKQTSLLQTKNPKQQTRQNSPLQIQQNSKLSARQNSPLQVQNSKLTTRQNSPLQVQQNSKLTTRQNSPLQAQQNSKSTTRQNSPLQAQQNSKSTTRQNSPLQVQQNSKSTTRQNSPLQAQQNSRLSARQSSLLQSKNSQQKSKPGPKSARNGKSVPVKSAKDNSTSEKNSKAKPASKTAPKVAATPKPKTETSEGPRPILKISINKVNNVSEKEARKQVEKKPEELFVQSSNRSVIFRLDPSGKIVVETIENSSKKQTARPNIKPTFKTNVKAGVKPKMRGPARANLKPTRTESKSANVEGRDANLAETRDKNESESRNEELSASLNEIMEESVNKVSSPEKIPVVVKAPSTPKPEILDSKLTNLKTLYNKAQQDCEKLSKKLASLKQRHQEEQEQIHKLQGLLPSEKNEIPLNSKTPSTDYIARKRKIVTREEEEDEYEKLLREVRKIKEDHGKTSVLKSDSKDQVNIKTEQFSMECDLSGMESNLTQDETINTTVSRKLSLQKNNQRKVAEFRRGLQGQRLIADDKKNNIYESRTIEMRKIVPESVNKKQKLTNKSDGILNKSQQSTRQESGMQRKNPLSARDEFVEKIKKASDEIIGLIDDDVEFDSDDEMNFEVEYLDPEFVDC